MLTYEAGATLFRSRWAGVGGGGAVRAARPGARPWRRVHVARAPATASRALLLPALLALVFAYVREPSARLLASIVAASTAMALVHPSHSVLVAFGLVGFLIGARCSTCAHDLAAYRRGARRDPGSRRAGGPLAAPVVRDTVSHDPGQAEVRRAFLDYGRELDVFNLHSYRLTPELFGRGGAIAVASLALLPLAVFAHRRMWAAFVLGAMLVTFAIALLPFVFPHFADAVSISQARRIIGFAPRAFALVGGALVLAGFLRWALLPVALVSGIVVQHYFPGDFGLPYRPEQGGPRRADVARFRRRRGRARRRRVFGPPDAAGRRADRGRGCGSRALPRPGGGARLLALVAARLGAPGPAAEARRRRARARAGGRRRLLRPATAYELGAFAPVYVNAAPTFHVADTRANHPKKRVDDAECFFQRGGPLSVPRATGRTGSSSTAPACSTSAFALPRVYSGSRYVLYRLPMKVLLVTMYWPPAGGGGVQRPLKLATHLPALGIETHVLAPDDPKWLHRDDELRPPTQAFVHRARYLGPTRAASLRGDARAHRAST